MKYFGWRTLLSAALATAVLSGCSSTDGPVFAELQEFDEQVTPQVAWETSVGDGTNGFYSSLSPVYADGVVYAADRHGLVRALDAENGKRKWSQDVSGEKTGFSWNIFAKGPSARISGGLTLEQDRLYFGTENGEIFALDTDNGEVVWRTEVGGEVMAAPAVSEGYLVAHLGNGAVTALDAATGESQWTHEEEVPPLSLRGSSSPVISAGGVMLGTNNGRAIVLILDNGQLAWDERVVAPSGSSDLDRIVDIDASPVVRGQTVYMLAFNGELVAMELRSGEVMWRRDYAGYRTPHVTASRIYVTTQDSHVVALERLNGNERWRNDDLYNRSLTASTEMGDYVVVGDRFGYVHWLNRETGALAGRYEADSDPIQAAPVRAGDYLIVQTASGRVLALTE